MRKFTVLLVVAVCGLVAPIALALHIVTPGRYIVTDVHGAKADPDYMLRLDDFFGDDSGDPDEVTFGTQPGLTGSAGPSGVLLDVFADGSAHLFGRVSVVEVDDSGGPGAFASDWFLDANFLPAANPPDALFDYFDLDPVGMELVNAANPGDTADLFQYPTDGSKPFQVGPGAIADGKCVLDAAPCPSAAGWLTFDHNGFTPNSRDTADFLMELRPIPEPSAAVLFGVGALVVGRSIRRKA